MGADPEAKLAYGYDLGGDSDMGGWQFTYVGGHKVPYLTTEADPSPHVDWDEFEDEERPEGLEGLRIRDFDEHKAVAFLNKTLRERDDWDGWIVNGGSEHGFNHVLSVWSEKAEWGERIKLDFKELERRRTEEGWDAQLDAAVEALGIKPMGTRGWFVFALLF